jgi:hypothetical protein
MMIQSRAAGAGNIKKLQVTPEKTLNGRLVGGVEHCAAGSAAAGNLIS